VITVTDPIPGSEIYPSSRDASFCDAYRISVPPNHDPMLKLAMQVMGSTPAWVEFLMSCRNRIVSLLGLKNLGAMSNLNRTKPLEAYAIGDRIGIFTLVYLARDEVIMGDNDKHLNVQVSIYRQHTPQGCDLTVATVVHNHNWLGRLYMVFVAPAHKVIVRAMLKRYLQ